MDNRIEGKLKTWNEEKGFGFITPINGGQDLFVHISNYPRQGGQPIVGETLTFEVTLNSEGKKKAVNVLRPGQARAVASKSKWKSNRDNHRDGPKSKGSFLGPLFSLCFVALLSYMGYQAIQPKLKGMPAPATLSSPTEADDRFRCDGRRYCSQMTSCAEATYFLRNCPGTEMDGDGDGVPCESQWCSGPLAK